MNQITTLRRSSRSNEMPESPESALAAITSIEVDDLFGLYTYRLEAPFVRHVNPRRLLVLYGDNGSGKTTLLRLIFHLLSKEDNKGHRTFLANVPFRRFSVRLGDELTLTARRDDASAGAYTLTLTRERQRTIEVEATTDESNTIRLERASTDQKRRWRRIIQELDRLGLTLYYLPDDRRLESPFHVSEQQKLRFLDDSEVVHARLLLRAADVQAALSPLEAALQQTTEWVRQEALRRSNEGQANANTIYASIVRQLQVRPPAGKIRAQSRSLEQQLADLDARSKIFSSFGLTSPFDLAEIARALSEASPDRREIISEVLRPYVDGLSARFDALQRLQTVLRQFLDGINQFFLNKTVTFDLTDGFRIVARNGSVLAASALSSGEKQLLQLFCNVVTARGASSIFLIDEPELSLNVKWQRRLIADLLELVADRPVQFVMATHSIELISHYRANVLPLTDDSTTRNL